MGLIFLNFIVQRIFRVNAAFPYLVHYTTRINGAQNIIVPNCEDIKSSFFISGNCYFSCHSARLTIGKGTIFAPGVKIITANHDVKDLNKFIAKEVKIGDNCWIGAGAAIMPGVELGNNVIVGANAVVTKSFESNVVLGGVPARILRRIE